MLRPLIFLVAGLVVGVGGGTGYYMYASGGQQPEAALEEAADAEGGADDAAHEGGESTDETEGDSHQEEPTDVADASQTPLETDPEAHDDVDPGAQGSGPDEPSAHETADATDESATDPTTVQSESTAAPQTPEDAAITDEPADTGAEDPAVEGATTETETPDPDVEQGPTDAELAAQRLARIFGAMQPKDAASVLRLLERSDIELIVRNLNNRSAAQILSQLDAEIVAELSRIIMHSNGGGA